jgi:hypothetical protein
LDFLAFFFLAPHAAAHLGAQAAGLAAQAAAHFGAQAAGLAAQAAGLAAQVAIAGAITAWAAISPPDRIMTAAASRKRSLLVFIEFPFS